MAEVDGYAFPGDCWYEPREHLWVRPAPIADGVMVTVGVDAIGQEALGEVVYVQLAEPGAAVARGAPLGSLEAEKMVRPLLAPVAGTLAAVNPEVLSAPQLVNRDPYGRGWLVRLRAPAWERERDGLLHDEAVVAAWVRAELAAYRDRR
jgi:glycine cleavage system H protein